MSWLKRAGLDGVIQEAADELYEEAELEGNPISREEAWTQAYQDWVNGLADRVRAAAEEDS